MRLPRPLRLIFEKGTKSEEQLVIEARKKILDRQIDERLSKYKK